MTISEVLIAATLLGFVIVTSLTALTQAYRFTHHARMVTLAGQVLQSVMEDLRMKHSGDLLAYAGQTQPVDFASMLASERFSSDFTRGFVLMGLFTTVVASVPPQLGRITVTLTLTWTENRVTFSRVLMTYFTEQGLSDYYYVGWAP